MTADTVPQPTTPHGQPADVWRHYRVGYGLLRRDSGVLLVCNRWRWGGADLVWTLPGGRADEQEPYEAAVGREVFEETGCHVRVMDLLYVTEVFVHDRREHFVSLIFAVAETGEPSAPVQDEAVAGLRVVPVSDLRSYLVFHTFAEPLEAYLANPPGARRYYLYHI